MAVSFKLRTQKTAGKAPLYVWVQNVNLKVNLMLSTHLDVDIERMPPLSNNTNKKCLSAI
jgi:hypothetical protein